MDIKIGITTGALAILSVVMGIALDPTSQMLFDFITAAGIFSAGMLVISRIELSDIKLAFGQSVLKLEKRLDILELFKFHEEIK